MNAEDWAGHSLVSEADWQGAKPQRRIAAAAPGYASQCNEGRERTPATLPTADALATAAPDALVNPTDVAYRRRLKPHPANPARCQPIALNFHSPIAATATAVQSNQVYLTRPATREWLEFCGASGERYSLGRTGCSPSP